MKKISVYLLLFCVSFTFSQDKRAKDLLNEVTQKIKTYKNIAIEFKYSLSNTKENVNQESKGNVVLQGNKYVLNLMGVTKIFDGKKTFTINPEDEEINISSIDDADSKAITPSKMLTFFNKGYKFRWDKLQNSKGRKIQLIELTPTNTKDNRKQILLGIDVQTKTICTMIEIGRNGTKTTLIVNSFKTNQPIPQNQFTFVASKYPKYYINKLD